jgi:hypothetical protein
MGLRVPYFFHMFIRHYDAFLSSLLDPLEGLGTLNCGKLELGVAPNFQH